MAYKDFDGLSLDHNQGNTQTISHTGGQDVQVPDASFIRDSAMTRDGMDLVLNGPEGDLVIKDYFGGDASPNLVAPGGLTLTPDLVNSFMQGGQQYAQNGTLNDESPVGSVQEVSGHATVTHTDGSSETIAKGTAIYQGDVIETDAKGAVNIAFIDETNFAVSEDARLAIDNYVYDPATQSGSNDFSVLKGVFVFTSGLIGRDDPDDVHINTPVGSIGIRGTIIAGNVNSGEITVVEGAIVLKDFQGHEMTLASQFETAKFGGEGIENMGQMNAHDVAQKFFVVSQVSPTLFSSINDAAAEQGTDQDTKPESDQPVDDQPAQDQDAAPTDGEDHSANTPADASATADLAPALPPVPPPVAALTTNGFTTPGGLGASTTLMSATTTTTAPANTPPPPPTNFIVTDTAAATANHPNTPPPPPPQENLPPATTTTTVSTNHAPEAHLEAPPQYFKFAEQAAATQWSYFFDKEFRDVDANSTLHYELSQSSINQLNALLNDGNGTGGLDVLGAGGWSFDPTKGQLILNVHSNFDTSTVGNVANINLEIRAIDEQGAASDYQGFGLNVYNTSGAVGTSTENRDNMFLNGGSAAPLEIGGDGNTIFLGAVANTISIVNSSGSNTGSNNTVYLGNGLNVANVSYNAHGNMIIGGDAMDKFDLSNGRVRVFGMDSDDNFIINLSGTSTIAADLQTAGSNTIIDGGHSNLRAADLLSNTYGINVGGGGNGRGDSLILNGTGSLDFRNINSNNQITSIERIDMIDLTAAQTVSLDYNSILRITDDKNVLTINVGANDVLNLYNLGSNFVKLANGDDIPINDAANSETAVNRNYDIYSDGSVTLLIHADAGGVVNIDGSAVAV